MTDDPPSSRAKLVFWGGVACLWLYLALHAINTPVLLDDWYQVAYLKKHGLTLESFWDNAVYNYNEHNPRLGENWLFVTNGPWWINTLVAPTVSVGFFFISFGVAFGRWPRATMRDAQLLLIVVALIWLASPIPGIIFVYRPFATNYLYAFACTLLFLVPFRMAADAGFKPKPWMIPAMFVLGWVAGMGNEHTGPTAGLAAGVLTFVYWYRNQRRLQAWMVTGLAGIAIGYPMLFFAPGQKKRYGQIAARTGPGQQVLVRGIDGLYEIVLAFLWEAQLAVLIVLGGIFVALMRSHRSGEPAPSPDRRAVLTMLGLLVAAFLIVATLFASPTAAERLFFASATLFALACAVLVDALARDVRALRVMTALASLGLAIHFTYGAYQYAYAGAEGRDRLARLEQAERETPDGVATIPPFTKITRNLWFLGEDFDYASLREFVGHEVYGLSDIRFNKPVRAEPAVPFTAKLDFRYEPPLPQEEVWARLKMPLSYISSYPDRDVRLIRQILPQLKRIKPGHKLVEVTAYVPDYFPDELRGRPLINVRWRASKPDEFEVIDYVMRDDDDMRRFFLLLKGTVPEGLEEGYIHACGRTRKADMRKEGRGVRMTYVPWCRGVLICVVCKKDECWNAATYWH